MQASRGLLVPSPVSCRGLCVPLGSVPARVSAFLLLLPLSSLGPSFLGLGMTEICSQWLVPSSFSKSLISDAFLTGT